MIQSFHPLRDRFVVVIQSSPPFALFTKYHQPISKVSCHSKSSLTAFHSCCSVLCNIPLLHFLALSSPSCISSAYTIHPLSGPLSSVSSKDSPASYPTSLSSSVSSRTRRPLPPPSPTPTVPYELSAQSASSNLLNAARLTSCLLARLAETVRVTKRP